MAFRSLAFLFFGSLALVSASRAQDDPNWTRPFPPFRIIGNIYWVGSYDLSSYLITTPKGHILVDCGFAATVPLIQKSEAKLGFKFTDVKILLTSHAHDDHVGGTALVHRLSGAKVMVMKGDETVVSTGGGGESCLAGVAAFGINSELLLLVLAAAVEYV